MKLWFQSCTDMGNNPIWQDYEECLRKHFRRVARPGTEISLRGTKVFSGRTRLYQYDVYLHTSQIIEGANKFAPRALRLSPRQDRGDRRRIPKTARYANVKNSIYSAPRAKSTGNYKFKLSMKATMLSFR